MKVAPSTPPINHVLFADDNLLYFKSSREGVEELPNLLEVYYQASSKRINKGKSFIFSQRVAHKPDGVRSSTSSR
jgi:hypothetical protein